MKQKGSLIFICLSISFVLRACGPSQAEVDSRETEIAAADNATQTAEVPTPTNTQPPTVTPTYTPFSTPTKKPTDTPVPTPTEKQFPTPISPQVPGWKTFGMDTVCLLEVDQIFPGCPEKEFDLSEIAEDTTRLLLSDVGISLIAASSEDDPRCDATLRISSTSKAISAQYLLEGKTYTCYSGAEVNGEVTLASPDLPTLSSDFSLKSPPDLHLDIRFCYDACTSTNIYTVFLMGVRKGLRSVWGMTVEEFKYAEEARQD